MSSRVGERCVPGGGDFDLRETRAVNAHRLPLLSRRRCRRWCLHRKPPAETAIAASGPTPFTPVSTSAPRCVSVEDVTLSPWLISLQVCSKPYVRAYGDFTVEFFARVGDGS